jgi:beta-glucuronidase
MSVRLFDQHPRRVSGSLDGVWTATPLRHDGSAGSTRAPQAARPVVTPGVWEAEPGWERFRGVMRYERDVELPAGWVRLCFAGVSHTAKVSLDGKPLGTHADAFTPWAVETPIAEAGMHRLSLQIDNTFGDHAALHLENDYESYGGITRPAEWQQVEPVYLLRTKLIPRQENNAWHIEGEVVLRNLGDDDGPRKVSVVAFGQTVVLAESVSVEAQSEQTLTFYLTAPPDAGTWSPESPTLHPLRFVLQDEAGQTTDERIERVGLRTVRLDGYRLLLNDQPIHLRGFNRHEDHPQFGCALPVQVMAHDLSLMRDCGANAVRTSHYPNDQRFLDLCDELGVLVWEESHARNVSFDHPKYREQIDTSTTEMLHTHVNHPSIVIWGYLNECDSNTEAGVAEHARVAKLLRSMDDSRLITHASNRSERDRSFGPDDIVSWNRYDNWYGDRGAAAMFEEQLKWLNSCPEAGGVGKPVIVSEFGAGAIYGHRSATRDRWTEQYQADALGETLDAYLDHPSIIGTFIWQFCDIRISPNLDKGARWQVRPRTLNNKGIVDEYRRPKLAYAVVRQKMRRAAGFDDEST